MIGRRNILQRVCARTMDQETPKTKGAKSQELGVVEWLKAIRRLLNTCLGYTVLAILDLVYSAAWTVIGFRYKEAQVWSYVVLAGFGAILAYGLVLGEMMIVHVLCFIRDDCSFPSLDEKKDYQHRLVCVGATFLIWPVMFYITPSEEEYDSEEYYSLLYLTPLAIFVGAWLIWGLVLLIPHICRHFAKDFREATSEVSV